LYQEYSNCSSCFDNCFTNLCQIFIVCSSCIFGIKFYIFYIAFCISYSFCSTLDNIFSVRIEFILM
jgi:hypothetical protein